MANNRDLVSDASKAAKHMQLHEIQSKLYLILFSKGKLYSNVNKKLFKQGIYDHWKKFDHNKDGSVKTYEVHEMLERMNIRIPDDKKKEIEETLDRY